MNNAIANSVLCGIGNSEENTLSEYAKNAGKSMVGNIAGSKAGNAFCVVTFSNLMHKYVVKNPTEILALNSPNGVRYTEHISGLPSGVGKRNNLLGKIPCAQLTENS